MFVVIILIIVILFIDDIQTHIPLSRHAFNMTTLDKTLT